MSNYTRLVNALGAVYGRYVNGEDFSGQTPEIPPQSDVEAYLYALAGFDVAVPEVKSELGMALSAFVEHADEIGGGGGDLTPDMVVCGVAGSYMPATALIDVGGDLKAQYKASKTGTTVNTTVDANTVDNYGYAVKIVESYTAKADVWAALEKLEV